MVVASPTPSTLYSIVHQVNIASIDVIVTRGPLHLHNGISGSEDECALAWGGCLLCVRPPGAAVLHPGGPGGVPEGLELGVHGVIIPADVKL